MVKPWSMFYNFSMLFNLYLWHIEPIHFLIIIEEKQNKGA